MQRRQAAAVGRLDRSGLSDLFNGQVSPVDTAITLVDQGNSKLPDEPGSKVDGSSKQPAEPAKPKMRHPTGPEGHRTRLRERFKAAPDALPDYELLEMLLFRVFPRGDTKPLAKALIHRFGSLAEVLNAPVERLKEVEGIGDRAAEELALIRVASVRLVRAGAVNRHAFSNWQAVIDYCKTAQAYENKERFRILFLDKRNQLIADEVQQTGTVDHTPVYVREVIKRGLELGATALILVHNHPSGDPTPSRADIDMTRQIVDAAKPLGIIIHDHIIVGRSGHVSLKEQRLM